MSRSEFRDPELYNLEEDGGSFELLRNQDGNCDLLVTQGAVEQALLYGLRRWVYSRIADTVNSPSCGVYVMRVVSAAIALYAATMAWPVGNNASLYILNAIKGNATIAPVDSAGDNYAIFQGVLCVMFLTVMFLRFDSSLLESVYREMCVQSRNQGILMRPMSWCMKSLCAVLLLAVSFIVAIPEVYVAYTVLQPFKIFAFSVAGAVCYSSMSYHFALGVKQMRRMIIHCMMQRSLGHSHYLVKKTLLSMIDECRFAVEITASDNEIDIQWQKLRKICKDDSAHDLYNIIEVFSSEIKILIERVNEGRTAVLVDDSKCSKLRSMIGPLELFVASLVAFSYVIYALLAKEALMCMFDSDNTNSSIARHGGENIAPEVSEIIAALVAAVGYLCRLVIIVPGVYLSAAECRVSLKRRIIWGNMCKDRHQLNNDLFDDIKASRLLCLKIVVKNCVKSLLAVSGGVFMFGLSLLVLQDQELVDSIGPIACLSGLALFLHAQRFLTKGCAVFCGKNKRERISILIENIHHDLKKMKEPATVLLMQNISGSYTRRYF